MSHYIPFLAAMLLCVLSVRAAAPPTRPATAPATLPTEDQLRRIDVDGRSRSYLVHLPPKHDPAKPSPVVLIYHGAAMNAGLMATYCGMNTKADAAGFVAVYPNGTGLGDLMLTFNAFDAPPAAGRKPVDDVAFTRALLDDLGRAIAIDPKRIYATGMSNGSMMCYRLAAELSDRIAAIAPVSGTLAMAQCQPKRPVPVIHFHGTADSLVPFAGPAAGARRWMNFKGVDETVQLFVKLNGCPAEAQTTDLPDKVKDGTTIKRKVWGPGKDGSEVVLYIIEAGGHSWPGQKSIFRFLGSVTQNISANDLIWEFFQKHPMP